MGKIEAAKLADRYLAGFPYLSLPDPEGYQAALVEVLHAYPAWAGERVVKKENTDNPNFPVADLQLRKWLEEIVRPFRYAEQWKEDSKKQIENRKSDDKPKQTEEEFWAEMEARGLKRHPTKTPREFTADLVRAKYGKSEEEWNAIPNQPENARYWCGER